jgi:hypothetical protein
MNVERKIGRKDYGGRKAKQKINKRRHRRVLMTMKQYG